MGNWTAFEFERVYFYMKLIPLTQGKFTKVDDEDFELLNEVKWHAHLRCGNFYASRSIYLGGGRRNAKFRYEHMHNIIMPNKEGMIVDHINRDSLDNRKCNLRYATRSQNNANRNPSKKGSSKYLGVMFEKDRNKWSARIRKDGKGKRLGCFDSEIEAAIAYNNAALILHGDFANLNIIL